MSPWAVYSLFAAKVLTFAVVILLVTAGIAAILGRRKPGGKLIIEDLNKHYRDLAEQLREHLLPKKDLKKYHKITRKADKARAKTTLSRCFVLKFDGDMKASAVSALREEVTAILSIAEPQDEVVVLLDSPGGIVNGYGLAASQLQRIKDRGIPLTACIDKMAASGGYLMACVADKILAAPFAIIGSIGVVAQLPNFNKLLKKNHIEFEQLTAGDYKRTLTMFGENTEKAREKFQQDLEAIHHSFKDFVSEHRPNLNIEQVATGEHWLASRARELSLVDELKTSDDYLTGLQATADITQVTYHIKTSKINKLTQRVENLFTTRFF